MADADLTLVCNALQHTTKPCNTLHNTAMHCNTLQQTSPLVRLTSVMRAVFMTSEDGVKIRTYAPCRKNATPSTSSQSISQLSARCNTLPHTATHCNSLQYTAIHCNNTLQHSATKFLQRTYIFRVNLTYISTNALQHTATNCITLQHTATHCNTLQRTASAPMSSQSIS